MPKQFSFFAIFLRLCLFGLICTILVPCFGQSSSTDIEWGIIPISQINMAFHPDAPAAPAVVLSAIGRVEIPAKLGFQKVRYQHHYRIKILSEEGLERAKVSIPFSKKHQEYIEDFEAHTINFTPSGNPSFSTLSPDDFQPITSDTQDIYQFTFANVKVGAVLEYRYTLVSEDLEQLYPWNFQHNVPVIWSQYNASVPNHMIYACLTNKAHLLDFQQNKSYDAQHSTWIARNLPAIYDGPFAEKIADHRVRIQFQLNTIIQESGQRKRRISDWPNVVSELTLHEKLGQRLTNKNNRYKKELAHLLSDDNNPLEQLQKIYTYIQNRLKWNGQFQLYAQNDLNTVWEKRKGSSAEINLLLVDLLRKAKIEAYPFVLSTCSNGKIYKNHAFAGQFNQTIAYAKIDNDVYLLNACDKLRPYQLLPVSDINGQGLVVNSRIPHWLDIHSKVRSEHTCTANFQLNADGKLSGDAYFVEKGFVALEKRKAYKQLADENEFVSSYFQGLPVFFDDSTIENANHIDQPLEIGAQMSSSDFSIVAPKQIYLKPLLFSAIMANPFQEVQQAYPTHFSHSMTTTYIINITLPDEYVLTQLPESVNVKLPNNVASFSYKINHQTNILQIISRFRINEPNIPPERFFALKDLFDTMLIKHQEQIVLERL